METYIRVIFLRQGSRAVNAEIRDVITDRVILVTGRYATLDDLQGELGQVLSPLVISKILGFRIVASAGRQRSKEEKMPFVIGTRVIPRLGPVGF